MGPVRRSRRPVVPSGRVGGNARDLGDSADVVLFGENTGTKRSENRHIIRSLGGPSLAHPPARSGRQGYAVTVATVNVHAPVNVNGFFTRGVGFTTPAPAAPFHPLRGRQAIRRTHCSPFTLLPLPSQPITDHRSPITDHRSPITDHRPPTTDHRSPITGSSTAPDSTAIV
jgi:hypothetical protein